MIIISYDISDNKKRGKLSKYIQKFGHRLQFSVYEIENSEKILNNIRADIKNKWLKVFNQEDSVYIFKLNPSCDIEKYGYAKNEDAELIIIS